MSNDDESFLQRWSRMKRDGAKDGAPAAPEEQETGAAAAEAAPLPAGEPRAADGEASPTGPEASAGDAHAKPFDLSGLPKIEELTAQSDIRGFLDKRVPAALRNAALRQMWTLDPAIRDFIEVADYQWDWNTPGGAPGYELIDAATTDVAALLAQATGAAQSAVAPGTSVDHDILREPIPGPNLAGDVGTPRGAEASAPHNPQITADCGGARPAGENKSALTDFERPSGTEAAPVSDIAAQQSGWSDADRAAAPARRHGGALPV